jgi:hypothetical protein
MVDKDSKNVFDPATDTSKIISKQELTHEEYIQRLARKRVMRKLAIDIHIMVYIFVNLILLLINILTTAPSEPYPWVLWVSTSWLIGVCYHIYASYYANRGAFAWHVFSYAVINIYLFFIYIFTTPIGYMWFLWILGLWGIGLLTHGFIIFISKPKRGEDITKSWIERKIEKELRKIYDISELQTPKCPNCGHIAYEVGDFCAKCGTKLLSKNHE